MNIEIAGLIAQFGILAVAVASVFIAQSPRNGRPWNLFTDTTKRKAFHWDIKLFGNTTAAL